MSETVNLECPWGYKLIICNQVFTEENAGELPSSLLHVLTMLYSCCLKSYLWLFKRCPKSINSLSNSTKNEWRFEWMMGERGRNS